MFKKEADEAPSIQPRTSQSATGSRAPTPRKGDGPAIIGPSIAIKGDVSGDEDLVIQGRVEGTVELSQYNVTIGPNGRVKADVNVITAFYVADSPFDPDELRSHMSVRVARYKTPRLYVRADDLPRSANGKLKRRALREAWEARNDQA